MGPGPHLLCFAVRHGPFSFFASSVSTQERRAHHEKEMTMIVVHHWPRWLVSDIDERFHVDRKRDSQESVEVRVLTNLDCVRNGNRDRHEVEQQFEWILNNVRSSGHVLHLVDGLNSDGSIEAEETLFLRTRESLIGIGEESAPSSLYSASDDEEERLAGAIPDGRACPSAADTGCDPMEDAATDAGDEPRESKETTSREHAPDEEHFNAETASPPSPTEYAGRPDIDDLPLPASVGDQTAENNDGSDVPTTTRATHDPVYRPLGAQLPERRVVCVGNVPSADPVSLQRGHEGTRKDGEEPGWLVEAQQRVITTAPFEAVSTIPPAPSSRGSDEAPDDSDALECSSDPHGEGGEVATPPLAPVPRSSEGNSVSTTTSSERTASPTPIASLQPDRLCTDLVDRSSRQVLYSLSGVIPPEQLRQLAFQSTMVLLSKGGASRLSRWRDTIRLKEVLVDERSWDPIRTSYRCTRVHGDVTTTPLLPFQVGAALRQHRIRRHERERR